MEITDITPQTPQLFKLEMDRTELEQLRSLVRASLPGDNRQGLTQLDFPDAELFFNRISIALRG